MAEKIIMSKFVAPDIVHLTFDYWLKNTSNINLSIEETNIM